MTKKTKTLHRATASQVPEEGRDDLRNLMTGVLKGVTSKKEEDVLNDRTKENLVNATSKEDHHIPTAQRNAYLKEPTDPNDQADPIQKSLGNQVIKE